MEPRQTDRWTESEAGRPRRKAADVDIEIDHKPSILGITTVAVDVPHFHVYRRRTHMLLILPRIAVFKVTTTYRCYIVRH